MYKKRYKNILNLQSLCSIEKLDPDELNRSQKNSDYKVAKRHTQKHKIF